MSGWAQDSAERAEEREQYLQEIEKEYPKLIDRLSIAKKALENIRARSAMCGYDSGDTATYELADDALKEIANG